MFHNNIILNVVLNAVLALIAVVAIIWSIIQLKDFVKNGVATSKKGRRQRKAIIIAFIVAMLGATCLGTYNGYAMIDKLTKEK